MQRQNHQSLFPPFILVYYLFLHEEFFWLEGLAFKCLTLVAFRVVFALSTKSSAWVVLSKRGLCFGSEKKKRISFAICPCCKFSEQVFPECY